jgi:hypothetical protein
MQFMGIWRAQEALEGSVFSSDEIQEAVVGILCHLPQSFYGDAINRLVIQWDK